MFSANSEADRDERDGEGGVKNRKHDLAVLQCAESNCGREREGVEVHIEAGGLIVGGMEECTLGGREGKERKTGGGHLALHLLGKHLWGQPIRGWVTPLSSQLASKSCATRQPTCLCSMNV